MKFANFDAISNATRQVLFHKNLIPLFFRIFILILIILCATGLGIWYTGESSDLDYMILIDASGSMLADDYSPNRLEVAKEAAIDFVDLLSAKTNVGLISFAGTPFIDQTLTDDKSNIKEVINSIDIINVGGTAIGDSIILAVNAFKISEADDKGRSIILLTDGQSNVGIDLDDAIKYATANGVLINTLGIGTEEGGTFTEDLIVSQLDIDTLEYLSEETGGKFYLVKNKEQLTEAYLNIFSSTKTRIFLDMKNYLLIIIFILLLLEWLLSNTRYKTIV